MKRKFIPVNTSNDMVIAKKKPINLITFDQLKEMNKYEAQKNKVQQKKQVNGVGRKTTTTMNWSTHHKSTNSNNSFNRCLDNSFNNNHSKDNRFPLFNTDKANFRAAFSFNIKKNDSHTLDHYNNHRETYRKTQVSNFQSTSIPFFNLDKSNQNQDNCTPKFNQINL